MLISHDVIWMRVGVEAEAFENLSGLLAAVFSIRNSEA